MNDSRKVSDLHITDCAVLPSPELLCRQLRPSAEVEATVNSARNQIDSILFGNDPRTLAIVGPCSIHDTKAGLEYARKLAQLSEKIKDRIFVVMRVYFEKPRTTVGWKGLIMDPDLDGSCNIPKGLHKARQFLLEVLELNLPTATELLDPITPQYISDLICWSAIGARTTESQTHRQMASGLSMPLGFKNATSGDIVVALNAIKAASQPQTFLGISHQGLASAVTTSGNASCHLILRGGQNLTNYDDASIHDAAAKLESQNLRPCIMIDCSHDNSQKDYTRQPEVLRQIISNAKNPRSPVMGYMIESNLVEGNQPLKSPASDLVYGQSITDSCIDWRTTEDSLLQAYEELAPRFA